MPKLRKEFSTSAMLPVVLGTQNHVSKRLQEAHDSGFAMTEATMVARNLIAAGHKYVRSAIPHMAIAPPMKEAGIVTRFNKAAPFYDRWEGQDFPFIDPDDASLPKGETHNEPGTRRSTLSGVEYGFDEDGRPQIPYLDSSGIKGRFGAQFSVNTTIDVLAIDPQTDEDGFEVLTEMSIVNGNDEPAIIGGYFESKAGPDGRHLRTPEAIWETKVKEFFEEGISGSIPLLPEFEAKLGEYSGPPHERPAKAKWDQVEKYDPGFLARLKKVMKDDHIVAEGPLLLSPGTTDNSWGESSVSWFLLSDEHWDYIVGDNPVYPYERKAGDDALDVQFQALNGETLAETRMPHRAFKAYIVADYILKQQAEGNSFDQSRVLEQARDMTSYLDGQRLANEAAPVPVVSS